MNFPWRCRDKKSYFSLTNFVCETKIENYRPSFSKLESSQFLKTTVCCSSKTGDTLKTEVEINMEECTTLLPKGRKNKTKQSSQFSFSLEVPNLVDIQRTSFLHFVNYGLKQTFQNPFLFSTPTETLEIRFFPDLIQFRQPEFSQKQAFLLGQTYSSSVYIPISIKSSLSQVRKLEWFLVGSLPLMTKHGHFVINGIPRVVLHQMVRNPGVYTLARDSRTQAATIRIVPERGGWINLTADKKYRLWFSTRTLRRKVSLLVILQALGFSKQELFERLEYSAILRNSLVKEFSQKRDFESSGLGKTRHDKILARAGLYGHPETQEEALRYLYAHYIEYNPYIRDELVTNSLARKFFWTKLWNKNILFLGKIGRHQFINKIGSEESLDQHTLTGEDLLAATQALLKLIYKERLGDEIDSLTQKRIRGCDEFLQEQFIRGMKEFETFFTRKVSLLPSPKATGLGQSKKNSSPPPKFQSITQASFYTTNTFLGKASLKQSFGASQNLVFGKGDDQTSLETLWRQNKSVFSKVVSKSWKSFFTSGTLAQFMDQTNPLAEVTHKRRLTVLGPGGVSSKQTTIQIRGIHPTFYGRLCPTETPEGQNAGLVNSFTVFAIPTKSYLGTIKTPFFQVYKGQVQTDLPPLFLAPHQEECFTSAPADICLNSWNFLPQTILPVRKEFKFDYETSTRITTQGVGVVQTISVATSLIPFLEHDDGNRALMGSNMQRQAVPLLNPEPPLVGTGLETRVVADVNHVVQASKGGYVTHVTSNQIQILTPSEPFFTQQQESVPSLALSQKQRFWDKEVFTRKLKNLSHKRDLWRWIAKPSKNKFFEGMETLSQKRSFSQNDSFLPKTVFLATERTDKQTNQQILDFKSSKTTFFTKKRFHGIVTPSIQFSSNSEFFQTNFTSIEPVTKKPSACLKVKTSTQNQTKYKLRHYQRTNQSTCFVERPIRSEAVWVEKGDILADGSASSQGKLAIGKNILVAYLPWEGYNFEDGILISQRLVDQDIFTSLHIDHYDIEVKNTQYGLEKITNQIPLKIDQSTRDIRKRDRLNSQGLITIGSWVEEGDYLVGKVSPLNPKGPSVEQQYEKLYNVIMQREKTQYRNTSLRVPKGVEGFVLDVQILPSRETDVAALAEKDAILRVRVVLLQRRQIQVGDKMAGRHGNKGIVSNILPRHDMPYLPDGTPIDIVLNPLGVPSRMNVGQILECLLGLAGRYLNETYTTHLFDEKFGAEASRSLVYSKLYEASVKTNNPWLFEPQHPGKIKLFDGRTGLSFDQPVTVGCAYILKLVHLVDDKIHARSTGPYSAVTQQPVRGRSRNGGQRLGEMEVWALQAYGAAHTLHELLTLKSDDVEGRKQAVFQIYANKRLPFGRPESFKLILRELQALCFDLQLYGSNQQPNYKAPLALWKVTQFLEENKADFMSHGSGQKTE